MVSRADLTEGRFSAYGVSAFKLLGYLDSKLDITTGYPREPSWGYAFTYAAAQSASGPAFSDLAAKSCAHMAAQDTGIPDYPWEFVVYALQQAGASDVYNVPAHLQGYHEKGTRMFNWFLLRMLNRNLCGEFSFTDLLKLRAGREIYQRPNGLIQDELKTRSLQYHAFCLFLLAELIESGLNRPWIIDWFISGVKFSVRHVLPDGTALYLGRGQEQIFGYGALIYALEYFNSRFERVEDQVLTSIWARLRSFQRDDGSFPLVLRQRCAEAADLCSSSNLPAGWYGYNSLWDYQPFLAYCFLKTLKL